LILAALAFASVITTTQTLFNPTLGSAGTIAGIVLLLGGNFAWCLFDPACYLTTEPWCESLLLLSLSGYARRWWPAGVAAALAALALRELVLPYCVVAAFLAWWQGRRYELLTWAVALSLYAGLFAWHCHEVLAQNADTPVGSGSQWLAFRGLRFNLRCSTMNVFVRPLPTWALAIYFPLAVLGVSGRRDEMGTRLLLSVLAYLVPFVFVQGNDYWGWLLTPWLMIGLLHAPAALRDLFRAVFTSPGTHS